MRGPSFGQKVSKPKTLGPEFNPWYWNPNRCSITFAPSSFMKRFKEEMGHELEITWNPINQRWQIWSRAARMQNPICSGWRLLFIHNGPSGEYLPLDERVYARLYSCSVQAHGSAKAYFDRITNEMARDKERQQAKDLADQVDMAMPYWEHSQIKVSGFGKSSGSKFSTYHT